MELDRVGNDGHAGASHILRAIGPVLETLQSLMQIASLSWEMECIVYTIIHIAIELHASVRVLMLLRVPPNVLVVDAPSTELIAQHLHATQEISIAQTILHTSVYTHVTRKPSAPISRMNSRAGMALYRAMILGLHFCQSSAFGDRKAGFAATCLSAPPLDVR